MRKLMIRCAAFLGLLASGLPVHAEEIVVYPQKGQSAQQQQKDKFECFQWAQQQTGFNPMSAQQAGQVPQQPPSGGAARGAGRGAAAGAVGGAIAGNAGKGAAIGAGVGAVGGGVRRREAEKQAAQQQSQAQAQLAQKQQAFKKAESACLTGRGYSVG